MYLFSLNHTNSLLVETSPTLLKTKQGVFKALLQARYHRMFNTIRRVNKAKILSVITPVY